MKLFLVHRPTVLASVSPYRVLDDQGQEIAWANAFLDGQRIRQLSLRSLRAYAFDLLHFARWWSQPPLSLSLSEITESTLLDYVRYQLDQDPKPTPQTVNHRLLVIRCLYRFTSDKRFLPGMPVFNASTQPAARSAMAALIAPWPSVFGLSNRDASSDLCQRSKSPAFGPAFAPSAIWP